MRPDYALKAPAASQSPTTPCGTLSGDDFVTHCFGTGEESKTSIRISYRASGARCGVAMTRGSGHRRACTFIAFRTVNRSRFLAARGLRRDDGKNSC